MFELFWKNVECIRKLTDTNEPLLPRKRKAPMRFEIGDGECFFLATVEEHYWQLYFEAQDLAITGIQYLFDQPGYMMYKNLEQLFVKAANKRDYHWNFKKLVLCMEMILTKVKMSLNFKYFV